MQVHATTAMLPGLDVHRALATIHAGVTEPLWDVSSKQVQLCPQTPTTLTESLCEQLVAAYPDTLFRTHANARVLPSLRLLDLSIYSHQTRPYYEQLADRARRLHAPAVSLHAGYAQYATVQQMFDNRARIQELFGPIPVAVEGLYPQSHRPQLISSWKDYESLLNSGVPTAIDVSHLFLVAAAEGSQQHDLVTALLSSPQAVEVHVSANDGLHDSHCVPDEAPWWLPLLECCGPNAVVFTEGNQLRRTSASPVTH